MRWRRARGGRGDELEKGLGAHVAEAGARESGHDAASGEGLSEALERVFARELAITEVFLHELVIALGRCLAEFGTVFGQARRHLRGDGALGFLLIARGGGHVGLTVEHVHDALELGSLADGDGHRYGRDFELVIDIVEGFLEIGSFLVEAGDEHHARLVARLEDSARA